MDAVSDSLAKLSDKEVVSEVKRLARNEAESTAALVALLAEFDARSLYLGEGCSSIYTYCTRILKLSEHAAYNRIEAARAANRFPVILRRLAEREITLTAVTLLSAHLTVQNHVAVLDEARHRSKIDILKIVASLSPKADVPPVVRKLPAPRPAVSEARQPADRGEVMGILVMPQMGARPSVGAADEKPALPATPTAEATRACAQAMYSDPARHKATVVPLAAERYKVQMTIGAETLVKLRRAQDLLRHQVPDGDLATVFDRALTLLVAELERKKCAVVDRPRGESRSAGRPSRHIAAAVKRAVWRRDGGRCAYVGAEGRCEQTGMLEFHHVVPYAAGGEATIESVELRCGSHNRHEAARFFGFEPSKYSSSNGGGRACNPTGSGTSPPTGG
jgi:hypothetical protein